MKSRHLLVTLFFLVTGLLAAGQMEFKEGYIINNKHERTDCLIRNVGQEEATSSFQYKFGNTKEIFDVELAKTAEFGIDGELKCVRALIVMDTSPNTISTVKDTVSQWEEGHAYLKVLVEGELATLYAYYDQGVPRFYYSLLDSVIEPLVYKKYALEITPNVVAQYFYNNTYIQQLKQDLACGNRVNFPNVSYTKKDLVNYFTSYLECKNAEYTFFTSSQNHRGSFRFKLGVNSNLMQFQIKEFSDALPNMLYSKESSFGFSSEVEYLIPFNHYKWGVFSEINFYTYSTDKIVHADSFQKEGSNMVDYTTLEFPVGITYYMNINKNHRLFVRSAFVPHIIMKDSYVKFSETYRSGLSTSSRVLFGAGYNYKRVGMECRYYTNQNLTMNIFKRGSTLSQLSFRVYYHLFETRR